MEPVTPGQPHDRIMGTHTLALAAGMAERDMLLRRLLIEVGNDDVLSQTASHRLPGCNLACW